MGWPCAIPSGHGWWLATPWVTSPKKINKSELSPSSPNLIVLPKYSISHLSIPLFDSLIKRRFDKKADQSVSLIFQKNK
jgi:hypothetical protein